MTKPKNMWIMQKRKYKLCSMCGEKIINRKGNALFCKICAKERLRIYNLNRDRKKRLAKK